MAKDWDYAKMVHEASIAGGPNNWIDAMKKASYDSGTRDMKNKFKPLVVPLILLGVSIGSLSVIGYQKISKWVADKKREKDITEEEAIIAEELLKKELQVAIEEMSVDVECNENKDI